jgi:hypothetical protein
MNTTDLTEVQTREREAFIAGARYMFSRLGTWYGQGHTFYKTYFEQCVARNEVPQLISMISEEIHYGASYEYALGWRQKMYERLNCNEINKEMKL